jgi:hypothetical protein
MVYSKKLPQFKAYDCAEKQENISPSSAIPRLKALKHVKNS